MNKKNKEKALNETLKEAVEETTPETVEETVNEPLEDDVSSQAEEEIQKWRDIALRSQAEMENLRKRTQIDIEKAHKYAHASFAKDLLPVADYLAGAIDYAQKEIEKSIEAGTECDVCLVNLLKGVEMTQNNCTRFLNIIKLKKWKQKILFLTRICIKSFKKLKMIPKKPVPLFRNYKPDIQSVVTVFCVKQWLLSANNTKFII